jgi:hypothetical protein
MSNENPEDCRHPAVLEILEFFEYKHLPEHLQEISKPVGELAEEMSHKGAGAELTAGLRHLMEAKDCFVRATIYAKKQADKAKARG